MRVVLHDPTADMHHMRLALFSPRLRRLRIALAALLVILTMLALYGARIVDRHLLAQIAMRVAHIDTALAASLPDGDGGPQNRIEWATSHLAGSGNLAYIVVFDRTGRILLRRGWDEKRPLPPEDSLDVLPTDGVLDRRHDLQQNGNHTGSIRYGIALDTYLRARSSMLRDAALIVGAGFLSMAAMMLFLGTAVARELARVETGARRMAAGDLAFRLPAETDGGMGDLSRSLNTLAGNLEARIAELHSSEGRLALVIQESSDGIFEWDLESDQRYYSPRFRELLGYTDEKTFRRNFSDDAALHPDDRVRVVSARKHLLDLHTSFDEEFRFICADGRYRWFCGRARAVWNDAGKPSRIAGSIADIDARRAAEEALHESEARFHHVVQGSSEGIWDWDLKLRRYYISSGMKTLLGYTEDELPNERASFFHVMHPADLKRVRAAIARHFTQRIPFDTELRLRHKDGSVCWYRARGHAVWDEAGSVLRFAGACSSIQVQKQSEVRIQELLAEKQIIIDNVHVGIVFVRNGVIADINRRMEELFGHPAAELAGRSPAPLFRDAADFRALENECGVRARSGQVVSRAHELVRCDGSGFWGLVTCKLLDAADPARGAIWIFFDDSDHRHAIEALRNERDFSDSLINGMPGVFYLVDRDGRFLRWNRNLEKVTGYHSATLSEMRAMELFAEQDRPAVQEATYRTLKLGENQQELWLRSRDGRRIPFLMTGVRIEVDGITHIVGIGFDITPRLMAEDQVRHLNEELEERVRERTTELAAANKELESFSYSVSHDLSAPLRGIDGFSRMLAEDFGALLPEVGRSYITRIRAATQRMQQLIDDLLRLSRVTRDELQRESLDLSGMARELFDELKAIQPQRTVTIDVAADLIVFADRNLLRIALSNLLRNAWKFTTRRPVATIQVGVLREGNETVYFVKDDGAGFDMRYAGRLFGAFNRLHRSSEFEGTGIGLAIVSRILQRHGGRIWAKAEIDRGATFFFTLGTGARNGH